ncbi:MAG: efflux RND transporter periplasmic adaptor subunit [Candidatus Fermentibacteraceae bacterium]|nr:efflux RND transporter periplasmic adaptor subunit [Candidatus Fermentibacteraceae bacterium]
MKKFLYIGVPILVLAGVFLLLGPKPAEEEEDRPAAVYVQVVQLTDISSTAYANTRVEGLDEALIYALSPGKVEEVLVSEGDSVISGQRLVRLNTDQQASAGTASASAGISSASANVDNAENNYERLQSLFEAGAISLQQLEGAEATLESARAQLSQARASYAQARTVRDNSWITAPFDGQVGRIWARPGNLAGSTPLLSISNNSTIIARILLPEEDLLKLEPGLPAYITVNALDNESFPGIVVSASSTVDQISGLVPAEVRFDDTGDRLRPGMTGRVAVLTETVENTIAVPESVLRRTHTGYQVVVVENGLAVIRDVNTGVYSDGMVQITGGLDAGDALIIQGHTMLQNGSRVEVVNR